MKKPCCNVGSDANCRTPPPDVAVYVDTAIIVRHGRRWAHLLGDSLQELHAFAALLGLPRHAFENKLSGAHYDLTQAMREQALRLGAVPLSRHAERDRFKAVLARARAQAAGQAP